MIPVYSFGPVVIQMYGVGGYILTWVASSISCSGFSLWWENYKEQKNGMGRDQQLLSKGAGKPSPEVVDHRFGGQMGASGSALGMSTALMLAYPGMTVMLLPIPIPVSLRVFNAMFTAASAYCMVTDSIPALGHAGHLGGMAGGLICGALLSRL